MKSAILHSGVKGMKWGVRRYQNKDGSLTPEGKQKYSKNSKRKTAVKIGAAIVAGSLVAYGAYRYSKMPKQTVKTGRDWVSSAAKRNSLYLRSKKAKANSAYRGYSAQARRNMAVNGINILDLEGHKLDRE